MFIFNILQAVTTSAVNMGIGRRFVKDRESEIGSEVRVKRSAARLGGRRAVRVAVDVGGTPGAERVSVSAEYKANRVIANDACYPNRYCRCDRRG